MIKMYEKIKNYLDNRNKMTKKEEIENINVINLEFEKYAIERLEGEIYTILQIAEMNKNTIAIRHARNCIFLISTLNKQMFKDIEKKEKTLESKTN